MKDKKYYLAVGFDENKNAIITEQRWLSKKDKEFKQHIKVMTDDVLRQNREKIKSVRVYVLKEINFSKVFVFAVEDGRLKLY